MPKELLLGRRVVAPKCHQPDILDPIARKPLQSAIDMRGFDLWTCWEVYWLNTEGQAQTAILQFQVAHDSPNMVESKSLKLYLNGLNYERFSSTQAVLELIQQDLQQCLGAAIRLWFKQHIQRSYPKGADLGQPQLPQVEASGCYWFDGFRSLCPVTAQPDFASVYVENYTGSLQHLRDYWQGFANHQSFHEQCVETMFLACQARQSQALKLGAAFLRRGGIDIHPVRYAPGLLPEKDGLQAVFSTPRQ